MSKTKCPKLIVLCCGKRKSGKDYLTDQLQARFLDAQPVIIRLSGPLKECYAKDRGLDFQQLLNASDYKEKYRLDMIKWSEKIRNEDHGYFCRAAIAKYEAINYPVWIVSDCRRKTDFQFFQQEYPGQCRTLRVEATQETRQGRGFVFQAGVDDKESECGLDDVPQFDYVIHNDGEAKVDDILAPVICDINSIL